MPGAVHDMTVLCNVQVATYRIAGNFQGRKLLQISWFCAESFLREFHVLHQFVKVFSLESFLTYGTVASKVGIQTIVSSHEHSVMIFLPVMHSWQNMCHLKHRYPTRLFPTHSTMTDFNPFFSWYSFILQPISITPSLHVMFEVSLHTSSAQRGSLWTPTTCNLYHVCAHTFIANNLMQVMECTFTCHSCIILMPTVSIHIDTRVRTVKNGGLLSSTLRVVKHYWNVVVNPISKIGETCTCIDTTQVVFGWLGSYAH